MTLIKRARRTAGTILRGLSNLMTGNYFKRLEQRLARLEVIVKDTDNRMKGFEQILKERNDLVSVALLQELLDRDQQQVISEFEERLDSR